MGELEEGTKQRVTLLGVGANFFSQKGKWRRGKEGVVLLWGGVGGG